MLSQLPVNLLRFFLLLFAQVFIFSNMNFSTFINPYVFPLFILLLPFETPRWLLMLIGLLSGLALDVFLGSFGMHAAACLALGYARPLLIGVITPKGAEFEITPNIHTQGFTWFAFYCGITMFFYLAFYFLVEEASFRNFFFILLKIFLSAAVSVFLMICFVLLFSAKRKRRFA